MLFTADDDASKNERHARSIAVGAAFEQQMDADPEFKAGVEKAQLMFGAFAREIEQFIATPEGQSLLAELRQLTIAQDDELEAYGLDRVGNDIEKCGELCEVLQLDPHDIKNLGDLFKQARTQHKREVFLETARLAARREPNDEERERRLSVPPTLPAVPPSDELPEIPAATEARHSSDFGSVYWFDQSYEFTTNQAECVKVLWAAWESKTPTLSGPEILDRANISQERFDKVFRVKVEKGKTKPHPAWQTMIVSPSKGRYSLNPSVPQIAPVVGG